MPVTIDKNFIERAWQFGQSVHPPVMLYNTIKQLWEVVPEDSSITVGPVAPRSPQWTPPKEQRASSELIVVGLAAAAIVGIGIAVFRR